MAETLGSVIDRHSEEIPEQPEDTERMDVRRKLVIPFGEAMGVQVYGETQRSAFNSSQTMTLTGGDADGKNKEFDDPDND